MTMKVREANSTWNQGRFCEAAVFDLEGGLNFKQAETGADEEPI